MDLKKKLVELLQDDNCPLLYVLGSSVETLADYLIANGVTVQEWISVKDKLPENEVDVLILAERQIYGNLKTNNRKLHIVATAFHTNGKTNTEESCYTWELDNVDAEYDEKADAYIIPEGWWESVRYGEEFSAVDDFVTHWMPLPYPPKGN